MRVRRAASRAAAGPAVHASEEPMAHRAHVLNGPRLVAALCTAGVALTAAASILAQAPGDRCLVPSSVRDPILNEISGEQAFLHVQMLSGNRDRQAAEYEGQFFETTYISDMARQYGLSDVQVDFFPTRDTWDAEEGDLWMLEPVKKKIASINMVPTALAQGSTSADVDAEVVYVGQGREADYAGRDVAGKIVLGNASVGTVFNAAVVQRGAAGALGTGSAGVSADSPGYTLDQVGWSSVSARPDRPGFGFALSLRQFTELRTMIERGQKVVMRAHVRSKTYPGKMNVISAAIPGSDPAAGELIYVAHAFETIATPGANDNCTGVGTTMEIARTLARLVRDGSLAPARRTIRFLWVPELSGSRAFMFKHPELQDKLLAALNFDMTGANMKTTDSYLRIKLTPDSRASYLNDLIASLLRFVDQSEIRTQQGDNGVFNYRLCPVATITSGSDHSVFNDGGIPAMQFNYWPDNFYHSSADRIVHVNPTEMKRIGFTAAAAFYYLANAGPAEARDLALDAATNGEQWVAEVTRQSLRLLGNDPAILPGQYKAAQNKVTGAYERARREVDSVLTLTNDADVAGTVMALERALGAASEANQRILEAAYRSRCAALLIKPVMPDETDAEREAALLVPRRLFKVYSEEAQKRSQSQAAPARTRTAAPPVAGQQRAAAPVARGRRESGLPGLASSEVANFIDGKRTVLAIYNAVRAECGNLVTGNSDTKFAYVLSPDAQDVTLEAVLATLQNMEAAGTIEIVKKAPVKKQE
jgi:aminopeptidase YwaD